MKHRILATLVVLSGPIPAQEPTVAPPAPDPVRSALYWADVDEDGLQDALAIRADGSASLLLNLGGGDFLDASEAVGLAGLRASSAAWGDADGDGRADLYLASREGPGKLLLQNDEGVFADVTQASGLPPAPGHVHARWYDFDADEKVDLHLIGDDGEQLYRNLGRARFEAVQLGPTPGLAGPAHGGTGGRGTIGAGAPGTTPGSASTGGSAQSGASFVCLDAITDQSSGLCLQASSLPTLGQLYPLGLEFNIDALGRVGIGTTTPTEELDVVGDVRSSGQLVSTATTGSPLVVSSSELVAQLNADRLDGLEAAAFRLVADPIEVADLAADSVDASKILDGSITADDLGTDSVGNDEIANSAVGTLELLNGSIQDIDVSTVGISGAKIHPDFGSQDVTTLGTVQAGGQLVSLAGTGAPLAVASSDLVALLNADRLDGLEAAAFRLVADPITAADLGTDSVGADEIVANGVGPSEIAANAVRAVEIATDAVEADEIAAGAVGTSELADAAVAYPKLAADVIDSSKIIDGTVTNADLGTASVDSSKIAAGGIEQANLALLSVGTPQLIDDAVTADKILAGAVGAPEIATNAVGSSEIADNAVGSAEIATNAVGSSEIASSAVGSAEIATNAVGSSEIADNAVDSAEIAVGAVGSSEIATNAVSADEIANDAVRTGEIDDFTILDVDISNSAGIAGTKIDADFGLQDVTTLRSLGVGTTSPNADIHVLGSNILASVQIVPDTVSNGDSEVILAEDRSASNGMKLHYDGSLGRLRFTDLGTLSDVMYMESNGITVRDPAVFESDVEFDMNVLVTAHMDIIGTGGPTLDISKTTDSAPGTDLLELNLSGGSPSAQYIECEGTLVGGDIDFRVDRNGDVFADGPYTGPADFAEMIAVSTGAASVEAGDVLVIDPDHGRSVRLSSEPHSRLVAGVYSTEPGFVGSEREWDEEDPAGGKERIPLKRSDMAVRYDEVPMAVVGIVPCKVSGENGPIRPGDLLVTSSVPGHAMVDNDAPNGTVLGKALLGFDGTTGVIKILVTLQ